MDSLRHSKHAVEWTFSFLTASAELTRHLRRDSEQDGLHRELRPVPKPVSYIPFCRRPSPHGLDRHHACSCPCHYHCPKGSYNRRIALSDVVVTALFLLLLPLFDQASSHCCRHAATAPKFFCIQSLRGDFKSIVITCFPPTSHRSR